MCAIPFQTIFDKGVSLLKMIENAGEDGWTDEIDDHTKSALIRLNEYIENKGTQEDCTVDSPLTDHI